MRLNENLSTYSTYASICRPGNLILIETGFFRPFDSSARCQRIRAILRLDSTRLDWSGRTVQTANTRRREGLARSLRTGEIDLASLAVWSSTLPRGCLYSTASQRTHDSRLSARPSRDGFLSAHNADDANSSRAVHSPPRPGPPFLLARDPLLLLRRRPKQIANLFVF